MRYGTIAGVGDRVSRLVLGSMVFSTEPNALRNARQLLDRFAAAGGTAVDTARIYAQGTSESAFGQWLAGSGRRNDMVVVGKGAQHKAEMGQDGGPAIKTAGRIIFVRDIGKLQFHRLRDDEIWTPRTECCFGDRCGKRQVKARLKQRCETTRFRRAHEKVTGCRD